MLDYFQCAFLVWCMAPLTWNGANFIYFKIIRPFVLRYENNLDAAMDKATKYGKQAIAEGDCAYFHSMYFAVLQTCTDQNIAVMQVIVVSLNDM